MRDPDGIVALAVLQWLQLKTKLNPASQAYLSI